LEEQEGIKEMQSLHN